MELLKKVREWIAGTLYKGFVDWLKEQPNELKMILAVVAILFLFLTGWMLL